MTTPLDPQIKRLQEENDKLSMVLDGVLAPIVYINADLQYVFINKAYTDWYELEKNDIEGKYIRDILAADVYERALPRYKQALNAQVVYFENRTTRKGEERYVSVRLTPHMIDGKTVGFFSTIMDITELKTAEFKNAALIEKLSKSLADVKRLSGLLPICSSCKKIRDDAGYWRQLEEFIQNHSDALFSHGICPECSMKLYGNEDWYEGSQSDDGEL